jgi:hypothetical protein
LEANVKKEKLGEEAGEDARHNDPAVGNKALEQIMMPRKRLKWRQYSLRRGIRTSDVAQSRMSTPNSAFLNIHVFVGGI